MSKIDNSKLIVWLTPQWLRLQNVLLLLRAWNYPVKQAYEILEVFKAAKLYRLSHNSQVCYMQKVLNDRFDNSLRRILITDFAGKDRVYLWSDAAKRDVYLGTKFLWPDNAYADSGVDFTVQIPMDVATTSSDYQHLLALVNEYRLAGKSFNIVRV